MSNHRRGRPTYHAHEAIYRQMMQNGVATWNERSGLPAIEKGVVRFFEDVLEQPWFPVTKRVIEFGCGTGPILRWLCQKHGWKGVGIDISRSAIRIAKQVTTNPNIAFHSGDITHLALRHRNRFDLVVDGQCLHCLTDPDDREAFWNALRQAVRPGGAVVIFSMARPVRKRQFQKQYHKIQEGKIYYPMEDGRQYNGARQVNDRWEVPVRFLEHWRSIVKTMRGHGFDPRLYRLNLCCDNEPLTHLAVAGIQHGC